MLECGNAASIPRVEEESEKYDEKRKSERAERRKKTREKTDERERHSSYALRHALCD